MKLIYLNGVRTGSVAELRPSGTTIGRENDNSIQLMMEGISRYHAKIERRAGGEWVIRDLGSTNGTKVNDEPVQDAVVLTNGCIISIGDQMLRCVDADSGTPAAPAASPAPAGQAAAPAAQPSFFFRPAPAAPVSSPASSTQEDERPVTQKTAELPKPPPDPVVKPDFSAGLFNKKNRVDRVEPSVADRRKKRISNLLFTLFVLIVAAAIVFIFLKLNEPNRNSGANAAGGAVKIVNPFVLYYEKYSVDGTSVFQFTLHVENGQLEVSLDEPLNKRGYYELFKEPIPDSLLQSLKQKFKESGFMELQQEKIAGTSHDRSEHRRIMIGFDDKFCDVTVSNDVSETFNNAEEIIYDTLLQEYDLGAVSQNVDRILEDAKTFLFVAQEAFRSIDTTPSNLPKAITNFRLAVRRYKLFDDPKPPEWAEARDGLAAAEAKLEEIHVEGRKNVTLLYERREYDKAIAECDRLLEIFPPDGETYKRIKETKIKIEKKASLEK